MIRFACPGCSATFTVGDGRGGKTGKCPKCQAQFVIHAAPADSPTAADGSPATPPPDPPPLPPPSAWSPPTPSSGTPPLDAPKPADPIEIAPCPTCQTRLSVMPGDLGADVECPNCKAIYKAVRADAPPPPGGGRTSSSGGLVRLGSGSNREDDDRPSRRSRRSRRDDDDDNDDDDRPRRSSRNSHRDRDDDDDRPSRRSRGRGSRRDDDDEYRPASKPSSVQTIGTLFLIGGILAVLYGIGSAAGSAGTCCLWPGTYYELVYGVMAIVRGSQMLGANDSPYPPRGVCIMAIICIVNADVLNMVFGIVGLSMLNSPEVQDYYHRR